MLPGGEFAVGEVVQEVLKFQFAVAGAKGTPLPVVDLIAEDINGRQRQRRGHNYSYFLHFTVPPSAITPYAGL